MKLFGPLKASDSKNVPSCYWIELNVYLLSDSTTSEVLLIISSGRVAIFGCFVVHECVCVCGGHVGICVCGMGACGIPCQPQVLVLRTLFTFVSCVCRVVGRVCMNLVMSSSVTLYLIFEMRPSLNLELAHLARLTGHHGSGIFILPPFLLWNHRHKLESLDLSSSNNKTIMGSGWDWVLIPALILHTQKLPRLSLFSVFRGRGGPVSYC